MSLELLKKQLKEGKFSNVYLLHGEEEFLKEYYFNELKKKILSNGLEEFNYNLFEGKNISLQHLQDSMEAFPVMAERKMIAIKDSGILKTPKAAEKEFWEDYLNDLPSYCCIVFYEKEIDKRSKIYKLINKHGLVVEFKYQKTADLVSWVGRIVRSYHKKINKEDIYYLLEHCDTGMTSIRNELDKVINYCGDKEIITSEDIDAVCTKSIESKIFEMIDTLMEGNTNQALLLLNDMVTLREPAVKILTLISRHFSQLLKIKLLLKEGVPANNIARRVGIPPFAINKYFRQTERFSIPYLHQVMQECLEMDTCLKTSSVDEWVLLQTSIVQWAQTK
jgi:DNA polymerase-3 subunit delta